MKRVNITMFLVVISLCARAQKISENELPKVVADAFAKKFPAVKNARWEKESANEFEAEFKLNKNESSASFDETGKWLQTETEIKKSELPQAVLAAIAKDFAGYEIEEAEKAENASAGILFEVELEKDDTSFDVEFSSDGKVIRKEENKEDDDKDDSD